MNTILLTRKIFSDKSTIGKLIFDDLELFTLEDTVRKRDINSNGILEKDEKVYGETAIPSGKYEIFIRESNRYKRDMPYLKDVPLFTNIMIHPGNYPVQSYGCILVGKNHSMVDKIDESKKAFDLLFPKIVDSLNLGKLYINIVGGYTAYEYLNNIVRTNNE